MSEIQTYKTYRFIDKDPMIDKLRTVVQNEYKNERGNIDYARLSDDSGVGSSTPYNWFEGGTRRPQYATMCAIARACGYDLALIKRRKRNGG